jgi:cytochrome c-type biogenesis protein CcmH/NrfG
MAIRRASGFIARQTDSFEQAAGLFAEMFKKRLTADERHQLVEMLEEVARHELPYELQIEAIVAFKPKTGLAPAA